MEKSKLTILWTSGDPITAEKMVFMYGTSARRFKWWDEVTIVLWGASTKLVQEDPKMGELIRKAQEKGVHISACKACADQLGAGDALETLGVEVIYWGEPLTQILKEGQALITI